ncbi:MAG TPA: PASTA domain-containing protein [Actinomycetota bacterium]|nr:PASTA domain-containing protein [Actinomycetota bacterium]
MTLAACDSSDGVPTPTQGTPPTGPTSTDPTGSTSPTPPPPPPSVEVPEVQGLKEQAARTDLAASALAVSVTPRYSEEPKGVVLKQTPKPGRMVDEGATIARVVAQPLPRVPRVIANNLAQAKRILRNAGYKVDVRQQNSTTARDGDLVTQTPAAGTGLRPGRTVRLVVINNICTPGYSPCLPEGPSDYDCFGGEGNGPFTEPGVTYRVTGFDPHDLDREGDGYGCE